MSEATEGDLPDTTIAISCRQNVYGADAAGLVAAARAAAEQFAPGSEVADLKLDDATFFPDAKKDERYGAAATITVLLPGPPAPLNLPPESGALPIEGAASEIVREYLADPGRRGKLDGEHPAQ